MNILCWHVHGSWMTAFVQGDHEYFVPVNDARDEDGRGRARTWEWPANVHEVTQEAARDIEVDVAVLQRPREMTLLPEWVADPRVATVYLEHNTPPGPASGMRHPAADCGDVAIVVHITHCNALFWDTGGTRTRVILNGIVDPGYRYTGEQPRLVTVINEAARRGRPTGTDLLARFTSAAPVDLFGLDAGRLGGHDELPQDRLYDELAARRVYLHPNRWTSLSLSLLEAMHLGLPVVALATTEVPEAVPPEAGIVTNDVGRLIESARLLVREPERARAMGRHARRAACERHGLQRFLSRWDQLLEEVAS